MQVEPIKPSTSTGEQPDKIMVPDLVTKECADEYVVTDPEEDDTMTISSTSTADYDRDEAEDLIDKIASCHTALAGHYESINNIIPYMTKTQLALYLGKILIIPMVKAEGKTVSKVYEPEGDVNSNFEYPVQGDTWEQKLQYMVEHIPAEKLLFAIAIGDLTLNQSSQAKMALKYGFAKTRIQRALSHDPTHKKGGRQYQAERKRKTSSKEEDAEKQTPPAKRPREQPPIPFEVLQQDLEDQLADLPTDEQGDVIFPELEI